MTHLHDDSLISKMYEMFEMYEKVKSLIHELNFHLN